MNSVTNNEGQVTSKKDDSKEYKGNYNRLFPVKTSTNTFLTIYMLHMLKNNGRLYGKELINKIEDRFKGSWKPSHGLVYPILRKLEEEGLVKGNWMGDSSKKTIRVYSITDAGIEAYEKEKANQKEIFEQSYLMMETLMADLYSDYEIWDFSEGEEEE